MMDINGIDFAPLDDARIVEASTMLSDLDATRLRDALLDAGRTTLAMVLTHQLVERANGRLLAQRQQDHVASI